MKKIFGLVSLFFLCGAAHCFAQNWDLKYYSSLQDGDLTNHYEGYALADFLGDGTGIDTEPLDELEKLFPENIRRVTKLTKNTVWLCKKALNEWEYEQGEYYVVFCADSPHADTGLYLFVKIIGKDDFQWWGLMVTEDTLDSFLEAFPE